MLFPYFVFILLWISHGFKCISSNFVFKDSYWSITFLQLFIMDASYLLFMMYFMLLINSLHLI